MMRWKALLLGLALTCGTLTGCKQRLFMHPDDYTDVLKIGLPKHIEADPHGPVTPTRKPDAQAPPTVLDPDRPIRYMTLHEAFAIGLEQGNVGLQQNVNISGLGGTAFNDGLVQLAGRSLSGDDAIQAFALDPSIAGADIERSLSKFDARWVNSMTWTKRDDAVVNVLQSFQNGDQASLNTALLKPLPTGGVAGITFSTDYQFLNQPPGGAFEVINPNYRPRLQVSFEQPLLQGFGVEINQLRQSHPGSIISQLQPSGGVGFEGILITRLRFDQSKVEFQRLVHSLVANIESAYWGLYGAYFSLYAQEQALRQSFVAWRLSEQRFRLGRIARQELAQVRGQFEQFRANRLQALEQTLEAERQLRGLLGMDFNDGQRIVPADSPTLAPYNPDWVVSLQETLEQRPELVLSRQDVKFRQLDMVLQKNSLLPDVRFGATYDVNGIGTQLDGSTEGGNALGNLALNQFNTWQLFLRADVPLGFRDAHAAVRAARLNLARSLKVLKNQEYKAEMFLSRQYQRLFATYELIRYQRATREQRAEELEARYQRFEAGSETLDTLLEAQRFFADALSAEYQAVVDYNIALSNFQFAKGTILEYNNIFIGDGPLPKFAMTAAADHFEARSRALVIRERAKPPAELQKERLSLPAVHAITPPVPDITVAPELDATPLDPLQGMPGYKAMSVPEGTYPISMPSGAGAAVAEPVGHTSPVPASNARSGGPPALPPAVSPTNIRLPLEAPGATLPTVPDPLRR